MLHCPRCLGPLQVREEVAASKASSQEQHPRLPPLPSTAAAAAPAAVSPAPRSPAMGVASQCPSGHLCPHATPNKARSSVYMSGGGVVPQSSSQEPQPLQQVLYESHDDRHHQQHQQEVFRPAPPPPPRLDMFGMQPQQQFGLPLHLHHHQQQQQQQQQFLCQQQHQVIPTVQGPQSQVQPHFAMLGSAAVTAAQPFPLFITSTIPPAMTTASGLVCSVSLSQPPTPAIVVGSTGNPFFPPPTAVAATVPVISQSQFVSLIPHATVAQQPPATAPPQPQPSPVPAPSPAAVKEILRVNRERLEECNWYYPTLTWNESAQLLQDTTPGTFLVRDSQDDRFLFSLSVQRSGKEGPTSVRIHFNQRGKFKLDAEEEILTLMPEFPSVLDLIDHYLLPPGGGGASSTAKSKEEAAVAKAAALATTSGKTPVWLDANGQQSSEIRLRRPLYQNVPSLAHAARLSVNLRLSGREGREGAVKTLGVPAKLEKYLVDYPNRI